MPPTFSVIVPNYNHAPYLVERIESILNQTLQDFELILLDDCSTDNSIDILNQYRSHPKVTHCVFNEKNSGSTFIQWGKGIKLAQVEYIWIAESDDIAEQNFLASIALQIKKYPDAGLFYTSSRLIDSSGNITYSNGSGDSGDINHFKGSDFIKQKLSVSNTIWNASMVVFKKSLYQDINTDLFSNMKYCGDWFFYALMAEQAPVVEIKNVLNSFRVHEGNVSSGAEQSGKTFTEGLLVYNYLKKHFSSSQRLKYDFKWAKSLYISQKKCKLQSSVLQTIKKGIWKSDKRILLFYYLYKLIKSKQ
jgi:glycosyltransferase involved in cell wall biosynthesis